MLWLDKTGEQLGRWMIAGLAKVSFSAHHGRMVRVEDIAAMHNSDMVEMLEPNWLRIRTQRGAVPGPKFRTVK